MDEQRMPDENVVSFGEWMLTIFLMWIPLVNFILLIVWAFGSNTKPSKANWAKATLFLMILGVILYFLVFASIIGGIIGGINSY